MGINTFYEFNGNKRYLFFENLDSNLDLYNEVSRKEVSLIVFSNSFFKIINNLILFNLLLFQKSIRICL